MSASTSGSNESNDPPTYPPLYVEQFKSGGGEPPSRKRRRFSQDTINDLLFWSCHLTVVAVSLGIMWVKVDGTTRAMRQLIQAQDQELALVRKQALAGEASAQEARNAEHTRAIQFSAAANSLDTVLAQVSGIQADIKETLAKATAINDLVLVQSVRTRDAAIQAQGAASAAAVTAGGAASAARAAAAVSNRTGNVVASKVVTSSDKARVQAEERALALKKAQLSRTIKQVKKNGPNLLQQIFH